ncbi:MAG: site-specific integrase [Lachnospiraceae bacterium]|nr:site-specific integrase [uncultured Acetatifactor sp.]MCI8695670.1 site-specific integrase [Lachnospiraceae bacterium]MCI9571653.1 site-specific integrase [Lachnospiraceae bacterium]
MARHGENIRKRKDGRWEARYQVFDADKDRKIYRSVYGSSYAAAKEKRSAAMQKTENPAASGPCTAVPFSQAAQEWLQEIADRRKRSTYMKYRNIYRIHLEGTLGSCMLSGTPERSLSDKIYDHLSKEGLSESIRKSICCTVKQILAFAEEKYCVYIPAIRLPESRNPPKRQKTFSRPEQSRLLAAALAGCDRHRTAVLLCLYTGMRLGELCALKWTDIDFENRTVTVNRTVQRLAVGDQVSKTVLMETDPKSESSRRTIPLTAPILERLLNLKEDKPYVFGGEKPQDSRTLQYGFKRLLKEAQVEERNFHILRHAFATNCIENGMDAKALSEILGHSDVKITLNRYVHPTMDTKREQIGMLSDFYGQICGQAA